MLSPPPEGKVGWVENAAMQNPTIYSHQSIFQLLLQRRPNHTAQHHPQTGESGRQETPTSSAFLHHTFLYQHDSRHLFQLPAANLYSRNQQCNCQ